MDKNVTAPYRRAGGGLPQRGAACIMAILALLALGTQRAPGQPPPGSGEGDVPVIPPTIEAPQEPGGKAASAVPVDELTMFRGNPQRNLSAVGAVPRRPKLLWRFRTHTKLEGPYEQRGTKSVNEKTPWAGCGWTGQPCLLRGRYYFGSGDSYIYCLDAASGKCLMYYPNHHAIKGSVAIFGDRIYHGGRDNKIHCYSLQGEMDWETRTGTDMDSSPVVYKGQGYIGGEDKYMYCFDPLKGTITWKYGPAQGSFEDSPCVVGASVIIGDSRGELFCLDRLKGALQWKFDTRGDTDHTPVWWNGRIYVGSAVGDKLEPGHLWCLESGSGKMVWHKEFTRGFWATSALNPKKDRLYIGNADGYFYALKMSTGETVWKRNVGARVWGSAGVTDGCVVFGVRDGRMWCLNENDGKPLWVFDTPGDIDATPCVAGGRIVIGDQTGWVYCIGEAPQGEAVNKHWFVTSFPQKGRTDHDSKGIKTVKTPAAPPLMYQDTSFKTTTNLRKPVYGPAHRS